MTSSHREIIARSAEPELVDDIVIQEFADGSLARLCPECAAGAALTDLPPYEPGADEASRPRKRRLFSRGRSESPDRRHDTNDDTVPWDAGPLEDDGPYLPEVARAERPPRAERSAASERLLDPQRASADPPSLPWSAAPATSVVPAPGRAEPSAAEPARQNRTASDERADQDLLDKTRELLMPVADLLALQGEMQSALERLASSLEQFAAEMLTDTQGKSSLINNRLKELERELEITRGRLREAESLLPDAVAAETAPHPEALVWPEEVAPITLDSLVAESRAAATTATEAQDSEAVAPLEAPAPVPVPAEAEATVESAEQGKAALSAASTPEQRPVKPPSKSAAAKAEADGAAAERVAAKRPAAKPAASEPDVAAWDTHQLAVNDGQITGTFAISDVQAAQRYYNESVFVDRIRDVRRSLGKPKASLVRLAGAEPQTILTVFWDIVWYQYLIDLRRDLPSTAPRVVLHREGMDLDELAFHFRDKNSTVNDDGRLDASELEVRLLSDPSVLITDMPMEETQAARRRYRGDLGTTHLPRVQVGRLENHKVRVR